MQRQKFNTLGGLNIQSTWCLECDSYMHTSSIAACTRREWITPDIIVRANTRLTKWLESQQCFPTLFRLCLSQP